MAAKDEKGQLTRKLRELMDRHRARGLYLIAAVTLLGVIAAQIVPSIDKYIRENEILQYLTLVLLFDVAIFLESVKQDPWFKLVSNQDESIVKLTESIRGSTGVDLLEYAGLTIQPLIRHINREKVPLRLLIQHPESVQSMQRQRTISALDALYNTIFRDYDGKFEIKCYRLPYTLRGRFIYDRILELGWLTPDLKGSTAFGHGTPSVVVDLTGGKRQELTKFFQTTFDTYWNHEATEDGRAVLNRHGNEPVAP